MTVVERARTLTNDFLHSVQHLSEQKKDQTYHSVYAITKYILRKTGWQPIATAPRNKLVFIYATGGPVFGKQDDLGNWLGRHNRPLWTVPEWWMEIPEGPEK